MAGGVYALIHEPTFKVIRFYRDSPAREERNRTVIKTGLTQAEAQAHCHDPETSSSTATSAEAREHTEQYGPWFDGWEEEDE